MLKILLSLVFLVIFLCGCASKTTKDPFGIGTKPTPPTCNFSNPMLIKTPSKVKPADIPFTNLITLKNSAPQNGSQNDANRQLLQTKPKLSSAIPGLPSDLSDRLSDFFIIMSPSNVVLTVWRTAPGNWIWAYTLAASEDLGFARVWRMVFFEEDVMILNALTKTCLQTYGDGVIHNNCDQKNRFQRFKLNAMSNGAVQIQNPATNKCFQTPFNDPYFGFIASEALNLGTCTQTIDEQWYIGVPPVNSQVLYEVRP